jgi:hypothetical protein
MKETDHVEDLGTDERLILQRILKILGWKGVDWVQLAGFCEYGRETSDDIKSRELNYQWRC